MAGVNSVRPFRASLKPAIRKSLAGNPLYRARKRIRNPLLYPSELRAHVNDESKLGSPSGLPAGKLPTSTCPPSEGSGIRGSASV
jgi:hypothetical protein